MSGAGIGDAQDARAGQLLATVIRHADAGGERAPPASHAVVTLVVLVVFPSLVARLVPSLGFADRFLPGRDDTSISAVPPAARAPGAHQERASAPITLDSPDDFHAARGRRQGSWTPAGGIGARSPVWLLRPTS